MRSRDFAAGIVLAGVLSGSTAEVSNRTMELERLPFTTSITEEPDSASDELIVSQAETLNSLVPSSVLPEIEFTAEDEQAENKKSVDINESLDILKTLPDENIGQSGELTIPRELLFDGSKIADISLSNPDGDILINMPLFVVTDLFDASLVDMQLERGAILLVAHPEVNPDSYGEYLGVPQMGLPGEDGITNMFGHNVSNINPDFDGNLLNGSEGETQQVFYRLDEVKDGAELRINFVDESGLKPIVYQLINTKIVSDVQPGGEGSGMTFEKASELYKGDYVDKTQVVQLIKCTPDGSVLDRFVAFFEPAD